MYDTTNQRMFHVPSTGVVFLGGSMCVEYGTTAPTVGTHWLAQSGSSGNGSHITFPVGYMGVPHLQVSATSSTATYGFPTIAAVDASGFTCNLLGIGGAIAAARTWTVQWLSLGSIAD
jgi:hypothetical protein